MRQAHSKRAFTLIELLVVVTIIVVLLALLTPAMDRAIYQAELLVCATTQGSMARGVTLYTLNFRRHYPYRPGATGNDKGPMNVRRNATYDDRPITEGYVATDLFGDPFTDKVDYGNDYAEIIWSPKSRFYGFRYIFGNHQGMYQLGDRWTWTEQSSEGAIVRSYSLLVADLDMHHGGIVHTAHPDYDNLLILSTGDDETATNSWWDNGPAGTRGLTDLNAAFEDGSVHRYTAVERAGDDRMGTVPEYPSTATGYADRYMNVPIR